MGSLISPGGILIESSCVVGTGGCCDVSGTTELDSGVKCTCRLPCLGGGLCLAAPLGCWSVLAALLGDGSCLAAPLDGESFLAAPLGGRSVLVALLGWGSGLAAPPGGGSSLSAPLDVVGLAVLAILACLDGLACRFMWSMDALGIIKQVLL